MAARDVQILKDAGSIAVRYANGNLRIPGFRLLENCNTTVDMDQDPEVFMMLEPVVVVRNLNKATPNNDSRNSSRRLRFIFKAVIMFFRWRLPSGERMLRENGIDNLLDEIFEEIRAALVRSDGHFLRFSAVTIKRCLQLFTASVLDHARTLLPTAKGDTTVRDLAREAWQSVKHFKAMLTQDWATIDEPNDSSTSGSPDSGPPGSGPSGSDPPSSGPPASGQSAAGPSATGPSTTGPPTTEPSGARGYNPQQSTSSTRVGELSFSSAVARTADETVGTPPAIPNLPAAPPSRGRGRGRGRGRATRGRGGPTALKPMPRGGTVSRPIHQDINIIGGPSSRTKATAFPKTPEKGATGSVNASGNTVLGKHPRGEPDVDDAKTSRSAVRRKQHDNVFDAARAARGGREAREAYYKKEREKKHEKLVAERNEWDDKFWVVSATHRDLACEVLDLRRRVRTLEKEKEEALSSQRQQLRPGLATMKMSPRVQQRAKQLFPSTRNGSGKSAKAPRSYHATWAACGGPPTPVHWGVETWLEHVESRAAPGDDETLPPPWDETPDQRQEEPKTGPALPPVGNFTHLTPSKAKKRHHLDSDNELEVPTESSWASTIPA